MARIEQVHGLLIEWAQWVTCGDGSGYSAINVLHWDWTPPAPGMVPVMKTASPSRARLMHRLIGGLSQRLANTLVMAYVYKLPLLEQAERLACSVSTLHARIDSAHRKLAAELESVTER
jgi:DNA-directed RNA polymerase specialized sigma24 family protein